MQTQLNTNTGLFSQLKYELRHVIDFDERELKLLPFILQSEDISRDEMFEEIRTFALIHGYSPVRVRQLIQMLEGKIKRHAKSCIVKFQIDTSGYASDNFFIVDQKFADDINRIENTSFPVQFIIMILNCIFRERYSVYQFHHSGSPCGIFYDRNIDFDFAGCIRYVVRTTCKRLRRQRCQIRFFNIFKLYPASQSHKKIIISIIKNFLPDDYIIDENGISVQENSTTTFDLIHSALEEANQPMHISQIQNLISNKNFGEYSRSKIHSILNEHKDIFGLKGPAIYGLKKWGGYFGNIPDVAKQYLLEQSGPVKVKTLSNFLCNELIIHRGSVSMALALGYNKKFVKLPNGMVGLMNNTIKSQ